MMRSWILPTLCLTVLLPVGRAQKPSAPARFPVDVLVQSPADTQADLQVICLFRSDPSNTLHGSLTEIDEKLGGILTRIRTPNLFTGALGETLLLTPRAGTLSSHHLLLIGLGDLDTFTPAREQLIGEIVFQQSLQRGVAHPFFAPTVLDGGKSGMDTGDTAEQFLLGFLRARAINEALLSAGVSTAPGPASLTFLAGATHATSTRAGITKALSEGSASKR
jgi:hypothetical protein